MPKIEVFEEALNKGIGETLSEDELIQQLTVAKAELDERYPEDGLLKIELNDTNRPDLWSCTGLSRQLKVYREQRIPTYDFFSTKDKEIDCGERIVEVDPGLKDVRPYIAAFAVTGKKIDEATLKDIIQTQEKLCWNYGRKRKSIAMGVYRTDLFEYPVKYKAVDPEMTKFQPLGLEDELNLREICEKHPKGQEFGHIVSDKAKFPFLTDANDEVLSFPPVINSASIGAVQEGDENLFIELTGSDIYSLVLTASIVACDMADSGFTILPVKIQYPYDTPFGKEYITPFYFQEPVRLDVAYAAKLLGVEITSADAASAIQRMGSKVDIEGDSLLVYPAEYRNDFLHPVDIVEDIMIGRGMNSFEPLMPEDFTIGRLSPAEEFARKTKEIMVGLGFQEMVYNYLGSKKDFIEKMNISGEEVIQIANPMTENYEYVRNSILPSLLESESVSANAVYPHKIFELGKTAFLDPSENYGSKTINSLGFLTAHKDADFNEVNSIISAICYYLNLDYTLEKLHDPRFIPGRCAEIYISGKPFGKFGELHPEVLDRWGVQMPCTVGEMNLDIVIDRGE
ncbi:MAG: phenylalanine--tRNA ligase subunit beta [Spirochaetia bacterium]